MNQTIPGTVFLIGAGPGDPELITLKGQRLLGECDVIVFDNLVPAEIIISLPAMAEKIYVGKKAADHALPQDEINQLLVDLARQGKTVARLKGADPLIFGRGGEEAAHLKKNNIPFEIVPGVSAAIGAAAYSGIPCTDRNLASHVTFATGHKASDKLKSSVPWERLAQLDNGTLVIYMGVGEVAGIVEKLSSSGMNSDTPAAVIERGTMPGQRTFATTLGQLVSVVAEQNVKPPSLFVIGNTVTLKNQIEWFGITPLHGKRVMVLRPADQAQDLYQRLRQLGAEVLPYPTIATRETIDETGWKDMSGLKSDNRWLLFTSENGVRYFIEQYIDRFGDLRPLALYRIAAVGFGTARALRDFGFEADFVPGKATVAQLAVELCEAHKMTGAEVVRVQGNLSDSTVYDTLSAAGARVVNLTTYETYHPEWPVGFLERLLERPPELILFTSGSTARGLVEALDKDMLNQTVSGATLVSIGPSTSDMIRSFGLHPTVEATTHSIPGMIEAILKHFNIDQGD